jgi:NADH-quinone oxidoreductase subunit F
MALKGFDNAGRRKPEQQAGSEFLVDCDMAILAVSQSSDLPFVRPEEVEITKWGTFVTDKSTCMTKMPGVFAGGDVARGSDVVITAIADGKNAAKAIDTFLGGKGVLNTGESIDIPQALEEKTIVEHERFPMKYLDPEIRKGNFDEVATGFHKLNAIAESMRCFALRQEGINGHLNHKPKIDQRSRRNDDPRCRKTASHPDPELVPFRGQS